jgi:serine protease AprX
MSPLSRSAVMRSNAWTRSASPLRLASLAALAATAALAGSSLVVSPAGAVGSTRPGVIDPGLAATGSALERVVVSGSAGAMAAVKAAVQRVGGTARAPLPIVDGVSAVVPADRLGELSRLPGVQAITADRTGVVSSSSWDDTTSSSSYVWSSQAGNVFQGGNRGAGVSVAVLDTGVSQVNDLSGRVMNGPDLSGENKNTVDSYGHGTVMAGIIAGSGADGGSTPRTGIAPGANIISVKLAGANGAADVSTVLAGLSWVGAFQDTYNIKVLNLSWGVASTQSPSVDPINYAVERLWTSGVVVVVAAGNAGPGTGTITKPGDDPLVITAGAYDDNSDTNLNNDSIPQWSSQGPTAAGLAKPDLVAPGRTVVATRSPGSTVETQNPKALIAPSYIKGSGTSEAAAVTSGASALLLAAHPSWTPDQVKTALVSTAVPISNYSRNSQGAGRIQIAAALAKDVSSVVSATSNATGTGTLQASRGSSPSVTIKCNGADKVLNDETTSWCATWSSSAWTSSAWTSSAWTSSAWTSSAWTSAEYDFLDAFWGAHPKWSESVAGERSDDPPGQAKRELVDGVM